MQREVDGDGVLVVGKERIPLPDIEQVFVMGYTASHIHGRNCGMRNGPQLLKLKARHTNANFNVNAQLGMGLGVSSVSCEVNDGNRRRPGRDVVAFSCGQGNLAIQSQTHDIDLSYILQRIYTQKSSGKRRKGERSYFQMVLPLTGTPHAHEPGSSDL